MKNDYRYTNSEGKLVSGNASLLHKFKEDGGFNIFLERRIEAGIQAFLSSPDSQELIEEIASANSNRNTIKMKKCC